MADDAPAPTNDPLFSRYGCAATCLLAVVTIGALLASGVKSARSGAQRNSCNCHLKQLGLSIANYESRYHTLPPAYIADADGKPMHSWRVLVLPYLEQNDLYRAYRFDEPWDGPNNRKLASRMPSVYRCPSRSDDLPTTSYVVVVGPQTAYPGATPMPARSIADGFSKTIGLVEVADSDINWMEPRDMTFEEALRGVNPPGEGVKISSHHAGGAMVGWLDAHVSFFPTALTPPC